MSNVTSFPKISDNYTKVHSFVYWTMVSWGFRKYCKFDEKLISYLISIQSPVRWTWKLFWHCISTFILIILIEYIGAVGSWSWGGSHEIESCWSTTYDLVSSLTPLWLATLQVWDERLWSSMGHQRWCHWHSILWQRGGHLPAAWTWAWSQVEWSAISAQEDEVCSSQGHPRSGLNPFTPKK